MGITTGAVIAALVFALIVTTGRNRRGVRSRLSTQSTRTPKIRRAIKRLGKLFGAAPEDEHLSGLFVLSAVGAALSLDPMFAIIVAVAGFVTIRTRKSSRRRNQTRLVERALPDVIDLYLLVVGAGCSALAATAAVAPRSPEPFRSELEGVLRRNAAGEPFVDALARLRSRFGASVNSFIYALTAAENDGVALAPALERVADEAHLRRKTRATEAVNRVPVMMLFPLVFCIFPAFGLLTVVPLLVGSIADLQLPT